MDDFSYPRRISPVLMDIPRFEGATEAVRPYAPPPAKFRIPTLNIVLFLATLLTTTMAGAEAAGAPIALFAAPWASFANLAAGLPFSVPLMLILFSHEMGHYLTSRRYGVDATLPYFIPAPTASTFFIGTFGAFIRMKSLPRSRRAMFDIGAAGPWAGLVVAIAALIVGLKWSSVAPLDTSQGGVNLGNSIIFWSVARVILGVDPNAVNVNLHPTAFAAWIGLLVTALNLLPVGQLDGGHVVYSMFGPRGHRIISRLVWLGFLLMAVVPWIFHQSFWAGWFFWFVLVLVLGLGHPTTMDSETPLSGGRRLAAWATVLLLVVTFCPVPFSVVPPSGQPMQPEEGHSVSVMLHRALPPAGNFIRF
jgi:membrane-associated protease RseP (regulator of RpoE activity)